MGRTTVYVELHTMVVTSHECHNLGLSWACNLSDFQVGPAIWTYIAYCKTQSMHVHVHVAWDR